MYFIGLSVCRKTGTDAFTRMSLTGWDQKGNQYQIIYRQAVLVGLSNACCWLPSSVIHLLSTILKEYPTNLLLWNAIVVNPINSVMNPLIFSLYPAIKEKLSQRKKATWLQFIIKRTLFANFVCTNLSRKLYVARLQKSKQAIVSSYTGEWIWNFVINYLTQSNRHLVCVLSMGTAPFFCSFETNLCSFVCIFSHNLFMSWLALCHLLEFLSLLSLWKISFWRRCCLFFW